MFGHNHSHGASTGASGGGGTNPADMNEAMQRMMTMMRSGQGPRLPAAQMTPEMMQKAQEMFKKQMEFMMANNPNFAIPLPSGKANGHGHSHDNPNEPCDQNQEKNMLMQDAESPAASMLSMNLNNSSLNKLLKDSDAVSQAPESSNLSKELEDERLKESIDRGDYSVLDIIKATQYGILERCKELIESGAVDVAKPDKENVYLIHWAAINNRVDIAQYYLDKGAHIDAIGGELESTPLHWATRQGHVAMAVFLVKSGANFSLCDNEGFSTIHLATMFGHSNIVAYLLAKSSDPDTLDDKNATPLMLAAQRIHNRDPAQLLITFSARINAQDINGNTPLHYAVQFNNGVVLRLLLDKGASLDIENKKGQTPMALATEKKKHNAVFLMSSYLNDDKRGLPAIIRPFAMNKDIRKRCTQIFPFLILLYIGLVVDSSAWILYKLLLLAFIYPIYVIFNQIFFDKYISKYIPLATAIAFIFWLYITWFIYYRPLVFDVSLYSFAFAFCTYCSWFCLYKSWKTNPGIVSNNRDQLSKTILKFVENNEFSLEQLCTSCVVRKPIRSKHCAECDRCVSKFDHHCPYVDNCIGQNNLKYFIGFVCWTPLCLIFYMHAAITYLRTVVLAGETNWDSLSNIYKLFCYSPWMTFFNLIGAFNLFWISLLGISHLYQAIFSAMTTNERMNYHRYQHFKDENGKFHNPFNFGPIQNCADVFEIKFLKPSPVDWIKEFSVDDVKSTMTKRFKKDLYDV